MKLKSKVNGLVIGSNKITNEVAKLGKGKFAEVVSNTKTQSKTPDKTPSKSQTKRVAAQKKSQAESDEVEQL